MIDGVVVKPLKLVMNERGRLMEVQRCDDGVYPGFGQLYVTETLPGVVKAWYRHHAQVDQIAPVMGSAELVLYDDRDASVTRGDVQSLVLDWTSPTLVQIPVGVWHGFRCLGEQSLFLLHLNDAAQDPDHLDEDRLPFDTDAIPYRW